MTLPVLDEDALTIEKESLCSDTTQAYLINWGRWCRHNPHVRLGFPKHSSLARWLEAGCGFTKITFSNRDPVNDEAERIEQLELKFPRAKLVFIEGNHEFRLAAYMKQGGGTLRNRISIPKELCLDKRDWTWVPYDHKQRYQILKSDMWARHEPFGSAQPSTQAQKAGDSFIYGHTHRVQQGEYVTKLSGRHIIAINGGWLGDPKQKVFGYVKSLPTWSWGFTIVSTEGKKFDYQIIKIQPDYTCIYNGKAYKG